MAVPESVAPELVTQIEQFFEILLPRTSAPSEIAFP